VPTTVANWFMYAPAQVKFLTVGGNLNRGAAAFEFIEEPFMYAASGSEIREEERWNVRFKEDKSEGLTGMRQAAGRSIRRVAKLASADGSEKQYEPYYADASYAVAQSPAPAAMELKSEADEISGWMNRLQETGILPLKIQLPKSGTVYRFNRLMTSGEPLSFDARFVHLRAPWIFGAIGLLGLPASGAALIRFRA
jgi:hypothetical protein